MTCLRNTPSSSSPPQDNATRELVDALAAPGPATALSVCVQASRVSPEILAELAEQGIAREWLKTIAALLHVPASTARHWLGIQGPRRAHRLDGDDSAGVLALARLIGRVQSIVVESGDPAKFDAGRWTAGFLTDPHPALGLRRPFEYMGTTEGRATVEQLIEQQQSGAYA